MASQEPAQLPSLQPGQTPQQSGAALSNNGVPPDRPGAITLPSGPPPRPPGLHKPRPVHSVGRPLPSDGSPHHQMQKPEIISFWRLICIAVGLLFVAVLILTYDPLDMIIDIESVKLRASIENATLAFEKEKTERERKVMVRERELWEKAREARVPQDAFWDVVWPAWDCRAYGKREYWGILRNTPDDWNAIDACMSMPVEIKGVKIRHPDRCAGVFVFPPEIQVRGYWMVDWDQPDCKPWYRDFEDKGCTGYNSGTRQIRAQIVGVNDKGGQDWWLLCNSTPLVWDQIMYTSPTHCEERLWGKKIAMWDVPDESCRP